MTSLRLSVPPVATPAALRGTRVLVVGLGTKGGGTETVRWLVKHGANVTVTDQKKEGDLRSSLDALRGSKVRTVLGQHREQDVDAADLVVRNPAVPLTAPLLKRARALGTPIVMDTTLFFHFCRAPIAGITGTRGKSTTTAVAGQILRRSRPDTVVSGNIERSPLKDLDGIRRDTPVVLELSSWQLEGVEPLKKSPHWAVLTTILPDHLNRYPSFRSYVAAKVTLVKYQGSEDTAILPADDPWGLTFAKRTEAAVRWFGVITQEQNRRIPGFFRLGDSVVLRRGQKTETVLRWSDLGGIGDHTKRNMLAGALLALEMGAALDDVRRVLLAFRGLPNRLEVIREFQGRTFVNDTCATTPEAVVAALGAFPRRKIVLICGGTDKRLSYAGLAKALSSRKRLRAVVLLAGSATDKLLAHQSTQWPVSLGPWTTMREAVQHAKAASEHGDVILLSPGAASFELFLDEFDRGSQFSAAAREM